VSKVIVRSAMLATASVPICATYQSVESVARNGCQRSRCAKIAEKAVLDVIAMPFWCFLPDGVLKLLKYCCNLSEILGIIGYLASRDASV